MKAQDYLAVLFNPDEHVWGCSAERLRRRVYTMAQSVILPLAEGKSFPGGAFLSINPGRPASHRCTSNVTACRNFLIEADVGTIAEQLIAIQKSGLPISAQMLSGGKSVHTIISLQEPVPAEQYREIHKRICLFVPDADPMTCDPSRFSRFPGAYRISGDGKAHDQKILHVGTRIANNLLMDKLFSFNANYLYNAKYPPKPALPPRDEANLIPAGDFRIVHMVINLSQKYPLQHGVKNRHLGAWSTALCAATSLSDEEICALIASYDNGDDKNVSEYQYAVRSARKRLLEQELAQ